MRSFLPQRFRRLLAGLLFPTALLSSAWANEISYTLPKDGRVSLAVYNAQGQMVRTLRNAEPQKAGKQTVIWDGLTSSGQPAPAGDYTWKLLSSQGMKAEYLLNLGISSGTNHWVGQHGGPNALTVAGDSFFVAGAPEGSPLLVKAGLDGIYGYAVDNFEPAGPAALAADGDTTYVLMTTGRLFSIDSATGKKNANTPGKPYGQSLLLTAKTLDPIPPTTGNQSITIPVEGARYLLQIKAGQENASSGSVSMQGNLGTFEFPATGPGSFTTSVTPEVFRHPSPKAIPGKELKIKFTAAENAPSPWAVAEMKLLTPAESLDARFGELIASFPGAGTLAWLNPQTASILEKIELPDRHAGRAVLAAPGVAVAISGNRLVQVARNGKIEVKAEGLVSPEAIAFDPANGGFWVAEGGPSQQVKFFDKEFQLKKTLGRAGGRKSGAYLPEDFLAVSAIAADGRGGFLITEDDSAPRRTAHFDKDGKLIKEWMGGQQFYTFAAPDPEDPNLFWMDSQWGWLMQVRVDWDKRDWKVLGTYRWAGDAPRTLVSTFKMAAPHVVKKLDLDGNGQKETYLFSRSNTGFLLKVDEANGVLQPVSYLGRLLPAQGWGWGNFPFEKIDPAFREAVHQRDPSIDTTPKLKNFLGFAWADENGNGTFEADEIDPTMGEALFGVSSALGMDDELTLYVPGGNSGKSPKSVWREIPAARRTTTGAPFWDWKKNRPGAAELPEASGRLMAFLQDSSGNDYGIVHAGGDGFTADVAGMGHGFGWPANQSAAVSVMKWNPEGKLLWQVGQLASQRNNEPGQLHYPVHFAGLVNDTLGVCDKVVLPVTFWTTDGLFAGSLFDHRADDGLPERVYRWWNAGTDDFDPKTGRASFQYDMALGGSLVQRPNGEVIFIGSGWNSCPAFRVTGWENFERQSGTVSIPSLSPAAARKGTGLTGDFYPNLTGEGEPGFRVLSPRIWFEPKQPKAATKIELAWPNPQLPAETPGIDHATNQADKADVLDELDLTDGPKKTAPPRPVMAGPFTARWNGFVEPRFSEAYSFSVYQKNGQTRLWVDGQLVAETHKEAKAFSKPLPLQAGKKVPIRLEWNGPKTGEIHLNWSSLSQPVEHIPASSLYPEPQ